MIRLPVPCAPSLRPCLCSRTPLGPRKPQSPLLAGFRGHRDEPLGNTPRDASFPKLMDEESTVHGRQEQPHQPDKRSMKTAS